MEAFFKTWLQAPLHNPRWSWGSVRKSDGVVFLRVWQDEKIKCNGKWFMRITAHLHFKEAPQNLGWQERLQHVELVRQGALTYMVMCEATDPSVTPREIKDFNNREVFQGGELLDEAGDLWLEMKARLPVEKIRV